MSIRDSISVRVTLFMSLLGLCVGAANAFPVTWTLSGVTFSDGGTATGSFVYDFDTNTISTWSVSVAGGDTQTFPPVTYDATTSSASYSTPTDVGAFFALNAPSTRQLRLPAVSQLSDTGGTLAVNIAGSGAAECYNCGPARTYTAGNLIGVPAIKLGGYLSGNWAVPNQGGHGFQLELTNAPGATAGTKAMVAIWFVYTPPGSTLNDGSGQNWIYAQGEFDPTSNTVTLPAILLAGAQFPPNFVASDVHRVPSDSALWGHLTFAFTDCNNGTVSWHSDLTGYNLDNDTPLPIQRITQIDGTTCP
jgi:hypothetical protein